MLVSAIIPHTEDHFIPTDSGPAKGRRIENMTRFELEKHIKLIKSAIANGVKLNMTIVSELAYAGDLQFRRAGRYLDADEAAELLQLKEYEARLARFIKAEEAEAKAQAKSDVEVLDNYVRAIYGEMPAPDDAAIYGWGGAPGGYAEMIP